MSEQGQTNESQSVDTNAIAIRYEKEKETCEALRDEARFILSQSIIAASIKIHDIQARVKQKDSLLKKCLDKEIADPFVTLDDIVGCRVICLFRSDMEKIEKIIEDNFIVLSKDDKVNSSTDSFGYMSVHYTCMMKNEFNGPRYNTIKGRKFEIQARTLSMHAWAEISHYLEYKGEWDVPEHLKKALNALSGLFYIADDSFESLYRAKEQPKKLAKIDAQESAREDQEINFDTISAYLSKRFPGRRAPSSDTVSKLVKQLKDAGYDSIQNVDKEIELASVAFAQYEKENKPADGPDYNAAGVVRISLKIVSEKFLEVSEGMKASHRYGLFKQYLKK